MNTNEIELYAGLKKFFGFSEFKGLQKKVIQSLLAGKDTFVIMPTGGGKSLCYQLPALMQEGTAIVVSPLIALMKNQVDTLRGVSENNGVAHVLNSSLNKSEVEKVMSDINNGVTKLLYVAPESLVKETYVEFLKTQKISFVAVDEAHCISEWGHDFRPDYRNLRNIINNIDEVPIIGLTATATEKVKDDIIKTLGMKDANTFKASFNRPNLFYEVRPKNKDIYPDILRFISKRKGKSGVIYCLSRKKVEEVAQILQVNNIKALPYHAGLDAKTRVKHQDMFLMEDVDVIVATIAFGMGIDKPDIRFVIHHDIPKSLESYYQETGRAGRDDGEGYCLAYYAYSDVEKLEKFMANKPVAEQEIGHALLQEVVGYAETSISRRKYLLHYFGESYDEKNGLGAGMDDNSKNPKPQKEAANEMQTLLSVIRDSKEKYKAKDIVATLMGTENAMLNSHKTPDRPFFGIGKNQNNEFWMALIRQAYVAKLVKKEIELYGVLKLTKAGRDFINQPSSFMMTLDHVFNKEDKGSEGLVLNAQANGSADEKLMVILRDLRKKEAHKKEVPPFAVFQDASLEAMTIKYPITIEGLANIHGVAEGKAKKYGAPFVALIKKYVEENNIERPDDFVVKGTGQKSGIKLYIIQSTDRKLALEDIAQTKGLSMMELIKEIETIVYAGTKLDLSYCLDEMIDEDLQEEIIDYFMDAETDDIDEALEEFEGEIEEEEMRIMRLKFLCDVANS